MKLLFRSYFFEIFLECLAVELGVHKTSLGTKSILFFSSVDEPGPLQPAPSTDRVVSMITHLSLSLPLPQLLNDHFFRRCDFLFLQRLAPADLIPFKNQTSAVIN